MKNKQGIIHLLPLVLIGVVLLGIVGYFGYRLLYGGNFTFYPPIQTMPDTIISNDWQKVDTGPFRVEIPMGWEYTERQGIDSVVGDFTNGETTLSFDYGWYSSSLAEEDDPDHIISHETIDGLEAKIVTPKITGQGITGVYFANTSKNPKPSPTPSDSIIGNINVENKLQISGNNLDAEQQQQALRVFRSVKFN